MNMLKHEKMIDSSSLASRLAEQRKKGNRIVFTNGCFDVVHPGHVDLLAKARALGDVLVVGLNSDDSVRRQGKGPGRPFNAYAARAFVLSHLESVDFVVCFDEDTPERLIRTLLPDILVKGGDYTPADVVGRQDVEKNGGTVVLIPFLEGFSTTSLARRMAGSEPGCHRGTDG